MDSSWSLMKLYTAVEYMHIYHSRYHVVHMSYENRGYGMATWPTLPYPEAGEMDAAAHAYFSEEQILGILLAIDKPPCLVTPAYKYPNTIDATTFVWRQKLRKLLVGTDYKIASYDEAYESRGLTNTIKQYLNFEFLRQLGKHDG